MIASSNSKVQVTVLETHLHFVEKISKSDKKEAIAANAFTFALSHFQIVASTNAVDLTRNILTIRLVRKRNIYYFQTTQTIIILINFRFVVLAESTECVGGFAIQPKE